MDLTHEMILVYAGLIWGLHLMTRAQDYRKMKERFDRSSDKLLTDRYSQRETLLKLLGFVLTASCLFYFYDILYNR